MKVLRTPDEQFANLPEFPFAPNYAAIIAADGTELRVHYLDEGPRDAAPVLLMHGEPSWSFLYRRVIPVLVEAGHRVIAPDLVGFGRSDKPASVDDYTYASHVAWMSQLVFDVLDLRDATFFGQDWGGLIGLRLVAAQPDRFARVVIGNTGLPTGDGHLTDAFFAWQQFAAETPSLPVGQIINFGTTTDLAAEVIAAYDAPFPDDDHKAGARIFPKLVPSTPDDPEHDANVEAWKSLEQYDKPFLCAFSDSDPITGGGDAEFLRRVPGTQGQAHVTIEGGGHFLQEDRGPELGQAIATFIAATS
ncbi:MAG: haloalkane dehalogenase [Acidimicrobiia bacterium]